MEGTWNPMSIIPISFLLLLFIYNFGDVLAAPTGHLCRPEQRDALLEFKNEFEIVPHNLDYYSTYGYPKTQSWKNNSDCCNWEGITCNAKSGEVIELNLTCSGLQGRFHSNSSLLNLHFLTTLDLSNNDISGHIPSSIGNISHLTTLSLSFNQFLGEIPSSIGNLSQLTTLELSHNQFSGQIPSSIGNLSQLTSLSLSDNQFLGEIRSSIGNLYKLIALDLSQNGFNGQIPSSIGNLSQLTSLALSDNHFNGQIPSSIGNLSQLTALPLSDNQFLGQIPSSIGNLYKLTSLVLSSNKFTGEIPSSFGNLNQLSQFSVDFNQLNGEFPIALLNLTELSGLSLSNNQFTGTLPPNFTSLSNLFSFDASHNAFTGAIPSSLFTIPSLVFVGLDNNQFNGTLEFGNISSPSKLRQLYLGNNNLRGPIPISISRLTNLADLDLSHLNTTTTIELNDFLSYFKSLSSLDLNQTLSVLNLRQNRLGGGLPENIFKRLRSLDVGHNQLLGKLPRSLIHFSTLEVLNVESNRINDTFPIWLSSLPKLQILVLRSNAFHGPIHQASFPKLKIIDISHNHFNGTLPSNYFVKWSAMSSLGTNAYQSYEKYMGDVYGYYKDSMVLMNKGVEMELVRILKIYRALDFSGNKLEGEIPTSIGLLKELHVLNLSSNAFTGHIPSSMGNLTALESLDVSQNKLSGAIPQELGNLSFLAYMNFSHNQLAGPVPGGTQFGRQNCSSFEDNLGLFGSSLDDDCRDIHTPASEQTHETQESEEEDDEEVVSWIAAAIGFTPGIVLGLTIGYILSCYRPQWFMNPFGRRNNL